MIPGINVSQWQREINWSEVHRAGVKFAFISATEFSYKSTQLCIDAQLEKNIRGASENLVSWGAIHHFCSHIDPVLQAKVFTKVVDSNSDLPPVVELRESGLKGERLNYKLRLLVEKMEEIIGMKPILCTDDVFWRGSMCSEKLDHTDWAIKYPLWISKFTSLWPNAMYPWASWDFWQHTDRGNIPGVQTDVNMVWFNGSYKELVEKYPNEVSPRKNESVNFWIENKHNKMIEAQKTLDLSGQHDNYKGDYQEPLDHLFLSNSQTDDLHCIQTKVIQENGEISKEDEWIRKYFLQTV